MSRTKPNSLGRSSAVGLILTAITLTVAGLLYQNRQYVLDQINVWQYQPSDQIVQLTQRSALSDRGKFYLYASRPSLEDQKTFNSRCVNQEPKTAILGCYTNNQIYIYNITNPKLDGIKAVTASHEMLHAAYARLSSTERNRINQLLESQYNTLKNDENLSQRMALYAKTEPGERDNELHSVIGSEIKQLSPELEQYYKTYFTDRQQIVGLHANYESAFTTLQDRADELTSQLTALATSVDSASSQYNSDVAQLNAAIVSFNSRANSGDFASRAAFNAERDQLMARADQLDQTRQEINQSITRYGELQKELQGVASQSEALNRSINSNLAPAPSV